MPVIKLANGEKIKYETVVYAHEKKVGTADGYVMDVAVQKENMDKLFSFCREKGFFLELFFGTLLGAVRDKDFIRHDDDADLMMLYEEMQDFLGEYRDLYALGFTVTRYDPRGMVTVSRKGEYVDLYFAKKNGARREVAERYIFPEEMVLPREPFPFLGIMTEKPQNHEAFFLYEYGETWTTPIKYEESESSARFLKIIALAKDLLPKPLRVLCLKIKTAPVRKKYTKKYKAYREEHPEREADSE